MSGSGGNEIYCSRLQQIWQIDARIGEVGEGKESGIVPPSAASTLAALIAEKLDMYKGLKYTDFMIVPSGSFPSHELSGTSVTEELLRVGLSA